MARFYHEINEYFIYFITSAFGGEQQCKSFVQIILQKLPSHAITNTKKLCFSIE